MQQEALKSKQWEVFEYLKEFPDFRLVGGTALALQIGHRVSVDFDLFSEKPLNKNLFNKASRIFRGVRTIKTVNLPDQLSVKVKDVKIDFVHDSFPFVEEPLTFKKVLMSPIKEIAAMKAYTLSFRGMYKDYVDLYYILKEKHADLLEIKKLGEKRHKEEFNFKLFLEQLIFLQDVEVREIEFLKPEPSKEQMKEFFEQEISKIKL